MERRDMRRADLKLRNFRWGGSTQFVLMALIFAGCFPARLAAQEIGQKTFPSAEEASQALVTAAQNNDEKAMLDVLGPSATLIVTSGDPVEDRENQANFVRKYQEMHRLVKEPDGTTCLYIGAENWPTPIPIVKKDNKWYFDTEAGKKEILYRRVGRNEMSTIRVCQELVNAQKEYQSSQQEYAQRIFSDEGQKNGLYWKTAGGEPQGPIGPLVLFLPHPHGTGEKCPGRREELHREPQNDGRIRVCRVSGGVPVIGRDDVHRRERRRCISKGSREENRRHRLDDEKVRS
jgi:hypothetical protein